METAGERQKEIKETHICVLQRGENILSPNNYSLDGISNEGRRSHISHVLNMLKQEELPLLMENVGNSFNKIQIILNHIGKNENLLITFALKMK